MTAAVLVVKAAFMDLTPLTYIGRLHPAQTLIGLTSSLGFYRIKFNCCLTNLVQQVHVLACLPLCNVWLILIR